MTGTFDIRQNPAYYEKNPKKKDYAWGSEMCSIFRAAWKPIIDAEEARKGMEILMAKQSVEDVKKSFKEGSFKDDVNIVAISVFEKLRQILISEFKKGSYMPQVQAVDPAAEEERRSDMIMLQNRKLLEGPMTQLGSRVQRPPFKMDKSNFNSNVDQFDEMGLDDSSPQDLSFFRKTYQRLDHEIAATEIIQALHKYNEFDEYVEDMVNDILAKKALAFRVYESPLSGEMKWTYKKPESVRWIRGKRRDGKDAVAIGDMDSVSVRDFLELSSGYFDFNKPEDRNMLLQAVRHTSNVDWYAISQNGPVDGEGNPLCSIGSMMNYQVEVGYMEWKSIDQSARKVNKKNKIYYPIDCDDVVPPNSIYQKEVTELQTTYKTFFIATGFYSQYMWNFGPLYHQLTEGANDEYSNYSYSVYVGTGQTAIKMSEPLLKVANFAFWKVVWGVYDSKTNVEVYDVNALVGILSNVAPGPSSAAGGDIAPGRMGNVSAPTGGSMNELESLISWMRKAHVRVHAHDTDNPRGGDGKAYYIEQGGLDPLAVAMQSVVDWAEAKISANLGINALREGYTPDPKDGYKLGMESTRQSRNATYYIPEAITHVMRTCCNNSLLLTQDCIALGGKGKDFITRLVGESTILTIRGLKKVALHRYGLFVDVYNAEEKRQEIKQEAMVAWQKGDIQYHEYLLIKEIGDFKKAAMTLAFFKERGERLKQKMEALAHQRAMELQQSKTNGELQLQQLKNSGEIEKMDKWGEWYMRAHQIPADAAIQKKQMEMEHEPDKQNAKASAKMQEIQAQAAVQNQAPLPPATNIPQPQQ